MKAKTKTFSRMSKAAKRVAIAKDVLAQLKAKRIKAKHAGYFSTTRHLAVFAGEQLKDVLPKVMCVVCAVGAAFVGAVNLFNDVKINHLGGVERHAWAKSREFFSDEQLRLIEGCYEGFSIRHRLAEDYFFSISDPSARLAAIFKNIIRNKGTFIPTERDFVRAKGK